MTTTPPDDRIESCPPYAGATPSPLAEPFRPASDLPGTFHCVRCGARVLPEMRVAHLGRYHSKGAIL